MAQLNRLTEPISKEFDLSDSDKHNYHFYGNIYEWLLNSLYLIQGRKLRVMEIGVSLFGSQGSFAVWQNHKYIDFVLGIDLNPYTGEIKEQNKIIYGNAYSNEFFRDLETDYPEGFDLIIDDGSHRPEDQIFVLRNYKKLCTDNGYVIVEDIFQTPVYHEVLQTNNIFIIDTSWNHSYNIDKNVNFSSYDHKLIIYKNDKKESKFQRYRTMQKVTNEQLREDLLKVNQNVVKLYGALAKVDKLQETVNEIQNWIVPTNNLVGENNKLLLVIEELTEHVRNLMEQEIERAHQGINIPLDPNAIPLNGNGDDFGGLAPVPDATQVEAIKEEVEEEQLDPIQPIEEIKDE